MKHWIAKIWEILQTIGRARYQGRARLGRWDY